MLRRYKIVVRDLNGKVVQIHEVYRPDVERYLIAALDTPPAHSATVTELV